MRKRTILCIFLLFILAACGDNSQAESPNQDIDMTNIDTSEMDIISQDTANEAKEILSRNEDITKINAVNTNQTLLAAIEIKHHKRFFLQQIEEDLKKELEEAFPEMEVELSMDKKMVMETRELEEKIESNSISNEDLNDEVARIIKFSEELA